MTTKFTPQISLLAVLQGLFLTNNVTLIAVNGLAGMALSTNKIYATLPITAYVLGSALVTMPAAQYMKRHGRKQGYLVGAFAALIGTIMAFFAMQTQSIELLCVGTFIAGIYPAFSSSLRFAAAEVAEVAKPSHKAVAISWVLAGGIAGGVIGPELSKLTRTALPALFSATYLSLAAFAILSMLLTRWLQIPKTDPIAAAGPARPLLEILRQPSCWIAVMAAMAAYGVMNLLMVATPLAMAVCKMPYSSAALVLEWHVIGMFAPGLFTGALITRFGVYRIMLLGCALMLACSALALAGIELMNFLIALFVLGVGWNFLYTGATTLLTNAYRPSEKARVQGFNDLCVFVTMITSSFSSGALLYSNGWNLLHLLAIPFVVFALLAIVWLAVKQSWQVAPASS
jgi:MFS family permease